MHSPLYSAPLLSFKFSLFSNLLSLCFSGISDCDESYNYWEPLHYLITSGVGGGFQTWEYSPNIRLRSYFYLWIFGWPAYVIYNYTCSSFYAFLAVRLYLSTLSSFSVYFLSFSLLKTCKIFNNSAIPLCLIVPIFLSLSPGNFISSTSFLPSAIISTLTCYFISAWLHNNYFIAIGCIAFSSIVIWPFSALIGIPLAAEMLLTNQVRIFAAFSAFFAFASIIPMLFVDSFYYGRLTFPTLNILIYNVFNPDTGSHLYGTEPISYYLKNYFLNLNILTIFLLFLPIIIIINLMYRKKYSFVKNGSISHSPLKMYFIAASPLLLWISIFFLQPHKEERFLFPSYPFIALCSGLMFSQISNFLYRRSNSRHIQCLKTFVHFAFLFITISMFIILSISRLLALIFGYSAPVFLIRHLPDPPPNGFFLCLARDWHLFPGRILLPGNIDRWKVGLLPSDFQGQLPSQYPVTSIPSQINVASSTRQDGGKFNLMNKEELDRYIPIDKCNYILDRDTSPGRREYDYFRDSKNWRSLLNRTILEPRKDRLVNNFYRDFFKFMLGWNIPFDSLARAFYFPHIFVNQNHWANLHLFERSLESHS